MRDVVIVSACRTPIAKFQGGLASFRAPELGGFAIAEALRRACLQGDAVDEVIMGNVLSAGLGQNPARQAARAAGIPDEVGSFTVNKVCGSGLKSVMLAAQAIRAGDAEVVVAGGMESMTNAPYLLPDARGGQRLGHGKLLDSMVNDGLWDIYNDFHMGITGEMVADKYEVTREAQDAFAANSHNKAEAATEAGRLERREVHDSRCPSARRTRFEFREDERRARRARRPRASIASMRPAFDRAAGSVTAGNASSINDGASALVVMSAEQGPKKLGVKRRLRGSLAYATSGCAPEWVMMAPARVRFNACASKCRT